MIIETVQSKRHICAPGSPYNLPLGLVYVCDECGQGFVLGTRAFEPHWKKVSPRWLAEIAEECPVRQPPRPGLRSRWRKLFHYTEETR